MKTFIQNIISRLEEIFNPELLGSQFAIWLTNIIVGIIIIFAFYILWRFLKLLLRPSLKKSGTDETTIAFLETLLKYGIYIIGMITALDSVGIQMAAVLTSLGIAGLTIGFAARDSLSNVISGILIFLDRPFVIGDLVEVEGYYGKVSKITLRSTRIVTSDGRMLAVPNTEVINKTVASYTNFPNLRLDISMTVGVQENLGRIKKLLLDIVNNDSDYQQDPPPRVVVTQLNDYNVGIQLQAWITDERKHIQKRFDLRESAFETLRTAGVDMPFETFALAPLEVKGAGFNKYKN